MWFVYSILTGFLIATSSCIAKLIMRGNDEYVVGWLRLIFAFPLFLILLLLIQIPELDHIFYKTILILIPFEILAYILILRAVKVSPLSSIMPFLAITPALVIITSSIILGERLSTIGIIGILLVVIGGYVLNIEAVRIGILGPVKAILKERGSRYMIAAASIFSLTSVLGKQAISHSSPVFFAAVYFPIITLFLTPIILLRYKKGLFRINSFKKNFYFFLLSGLLFVLANLFHCLAISMTAAAYMIAVKRSSIFFGVIYGALVFKESNIRERLSGASIMFLGIILISLA